MQEKSQYDSKSFDNFYKHYCKLRRKTPKDVSSEEFDLVCSQYDLYLKAKEMFKEVVVRNDFINSLEKYFKRTRTLSDKQYKCLEDYLKYRNK